MVKNLKWKTILVILVIGLAGWSAYPPQKKVNLGLDLKGGMHLVLKVDLSKLSEKDKKDATDRALEIIRNRIDQFGVKEPSIQRQGKDQIVVQLPGVTDIERAIELIGKTALLEFKIVSDDTGKLKDALDGKVPEGYDLKYAGEEPLLLEKEPSLTGEALVDAKVSFDPSRFNEPYVSFKLNSKGARRFAIVTRDNIGRRLAIVLDDKVQSAPVIQSEIPLGEGQITGRFSIEEAGDLAIILRAGALPAPIGVEEERVVGPSLGKDSIEKGVKATLIGACLVFVFMAIYYFLSGLIANFALCLNLVLILGVLSYLKAALTLPGIAGIALTIGMAVDANVLVSERMREELKLGKTIRSVVAFGYDKAFHAIFDSNVTTLVAGIILFWIGSGPVRGFATTLSIGIMTTLFSAIVVTHLIFDYLLAGKKINKLPMLEFIKEPKFDFIGKRKLFYIISILFISFGLFAIFSRGQKNLGIDFMGGMIQEYEFQDKVSLEQIRDSLNKVGLGDSLIQSIRGTSRFILRTRADVSGEIRDEFTLTFGKDKFDILRVEKVGPAAGKDLIKKSLWAIALSLVGILVYVWIRFEFRFAVAGIIGLLHDVLVAAGALALTHREISLTVVAALLTIIGYSINDTVVIYDRIRENLRLMRKVDFPTIINFSLNQTLSRTMITSGVTLLVVIALFLLGGEVINDFAFTLLVGMISGVYSTVFVSSPILVDWKRKKMSK